MSLIPEFGPKIVIRMKTVAATNQTNSESMGEVRGTASPCVDLQVPPCDSAGHMLAGSGNEQNV